MKIEQTSSNNRNLFSGRLGQYKEIHIKDAAFLDAINKVTDKIDPNNATKLYLLVIAPALIEFVMWVLEDAIERGIKRLYFLSRDGYQMYLIAQHLNDVKKLGLDLRYLYVSRFSMRLPGYVIDPDSALDRICVGGIDVTLKKILANASLNNDEILELIDSLGEDFDFKPDEILNYRQIQRLKNSLKDCELLNKYMNMHSTLALDSAIGYLSQEGLLDNIRFAVVDSGWVGTLQMSIQTLLRTKKPELHMEGYYFGMYSYPDNAIRECFNPWYFGPEWGKSRKVFFSNSLFETIVSYTEPICLGYTKNEEGRFRPVLSKRSNPNYDHIVNNIEALKALLVNLPEEFTGFKTEKSLERLFKLFMAYPKAREVSSYGNDAFSDDVLDKDMVYVASPLTIAEIHNHRLHNKLLIMSKIKDDTLRESPWLEGSVIRAIRSEKHERTKEERIIKKELRHIHRYKKVLFSRKEHEARKYKDVKLSKKHKIKNDIQKNSDIITDDVLENAVTTSVDRKHKRAQTKQYVFVIRELTGREIKRKYARSKLGIVWSVLNPLLHMLVMTLIFSTMFKRSIDKFPLYYLTGQLFYSLFSGATNSAMTALVDNKTLLLRAKLPKQIFVLSRIYTSLVNFGYSFAAYAIVLILFRTKPSWLMLMLPFDLLLMLVFSMGVGYILSVIYIFFADIKYLYDGVFLTLLMYMSALFYPVSRLPEIMQKILGYNPIFLSIYIARECMVYGNIPHYTAWLKLLAYAAISFSVGYSLFKHKQDRIMQVI